MKIKFTFLIIVLFYPFILSSQCNNNFIANGSFEIGNPTSSDEDIDNAQSWSGIWTCSGGGGCSTGEFYNVNTTSMPGVLTPPIPSSQQNFGGFWCNIMDNPHYREGIINQLSNPIIGGSGSYNLCLKIACLLYTGGTPNLAIYGVPTGAVGTGAPGATVPLNEGLFSPAAILLGQVYFDFDICDHNFQTYSLLFDSNTFPTGVSIDRVFFTRGDGVPGGVYIAIDDICISQDAATSPPLIVCPEDITLDCDPNTCSAIYSPPDPIVDNSFCTSSTVSCLRDDGLDLTDPFPTGITTITCIADNGFGTDTCSYQITVYDTQPPEANCNSSIVVSLPFDGSPLILGLNEIENGSTDNCAIASMTLDLDTFDCSYAFQTQIVTLIVEDSSGNISECESSVYIESEIAVLNLDLEICEGDTVFVNDNQYFQTGFYQEIIESAEECDSFININLITVPCNISSNYFSTPAICNGDAIGVIEFSVENGTPLFNYTWQDLGGAYNGSGIINSVDESIFIDNLLAGTYVIHIQDQNGNNEVIITEILSYPITEVQFSASNYNGYNVSCSTSNNGSLEAIVPNGVNGSTFLWSTGQTVNSIDQLQAGSYSVTLVDEFGCTSEGSYELIAPPNLEFATVQEDPICEDLESGSIAVVQTIGGVPDYSFSLNGGDYAANQVFEGLPLGNYTVQVMDANGCMVELSEILSAPEYPQVELGSDYEIFLGELITLNPLVNNINIQELLWQSNELLDCYNCLQPSAIPLNSGLYTLAVTSEDDCIGIDSIFIEVNKSRDIFAPNVFTPNFDGTNDFFTLFGGSDVAMIRKLTIFNRWGAIVFEAKDIEAGKESLGWDGTFKGKDLNPDVFAWIAEVEFIDAEIFPFSGDITIVK